MSQANPLPSSRHLLVRTARGEPVERPPVWAMRQAGRWDPEFNRLRAGHSFYEFSENVELAAKASLLPRCFGVDAIILFYDITTLAVAMGLPSTLQPTQGPVPLQRVREELRGELPVVVFAGAPFTLATYCINTGKNIAATRTFIQENPAVWQ